MKKKLLPAVLAVLIFLSGCHKEQPTVQTDGATVPIDTISASEPTPSQPAGADDTVPPSTEGGSGNAEIFDTYHSGKPYTPWGTPQTTTLTANSGKTVSFTGNIPEEDPGVQFVDWLWWTSTNDMNTSYMLAFIDGEQCLIQSPETFYEDLGQQFVEQVYWSFNITAKEAEIDIRDNVTVRKNGIKMCRSVGAVSWSLNGKQRDRSFVSYVFAAPDGGYLCCLFQCEKTDWAATQEAAENFVNTFRWET